MRNVLAIAAIADLLENEHESNFPLVIFEHLKFDIEEDKLKKVLAWIIYHPDGGKIPEEVPEMGIEGKVFEQGIRERSEAYARKLLGRVTGAIK